MKRYLVFFAAAAAVGAVLMFLQSYVYGTGFLVFLLGALLIFIGWWVLLMAPYQRSGLRMTAKVLRSATLCLVGLMTLSFFIVEGQIYANARGDADTDAPAIIVLGAGLRGENPSLALKYRLDAAKTWLDVHPDAVAVLSGGQGPLEDIAEAEAMRRYLVQAGVEESRLILETESHNTLQNIAFSKALLGEQGLADKPVAVVSTNFHLYRLRRICKSAGLDARMVAAPVPMVGLVPLNSWLREYASVILLYTKEILA